MIQIVITILTILMIEMLLSLDNSIAISMIASKAAPEDRKKVISWGIWGAFILRGLSILCVSFLLSNPSIGGYAKLIGGAYLVKLGYSLFTPEADSIEEGSVPKWLESLLKWLGLSLIWVVIFEIEILDLSLSLDNLLATVSLAEGIKGTILGMPANLVTCVIGIFGGIVLMRLVTNYVMKLVEKYPALNQSAAVVISLLGLKMIISAVYTLFPNLTGKDFFENHYTDIIFSTLTILIFLFPIIKSKKVCNS